MNSTINAPDHELAPQPTSSAFKRACYVLLFAAALAGIAAAIRYLLIEPDEMGARCTVERMTASGLCRLRGWAIQGFARHLYGPISLATAVLGWIGDSAYLAVLAMIVGMCGVVLYDFDIAAVGLLLGALLLVRGKR